MPTYKRERSLDEQVAVLTAQVAQLRRSGSVVDDVSLFATGFENYNYDDASVALSTVFENTFTPRGASLVIGLSVFGDQVSAVNTGGTWDVLVNGVTAAAGTVPATFTIVNSDVVIDLSPYLGTTSVHVEIRTRRTAGATTGGRYGGGGCIASTVRYARMS
jgi:hypothetical protein